MPETVVHFQIRINPMTYEQLASWAKEGKESLNALVVRILKEAAERHDVKPAKPSGLVKPSKT
jgi:predicted HicB family RNase H-like nuclease